MTLDEALASSIAEIFIRNKITSQPSCKEDCYWYYEWQDMNASIPACKIKKNLFSLDPIDCEDCKDYHNRLVKTEGDSIREMSDYDLADLLYSANNSSEEHDYLYWLHWLKEPHKSKGQAD